MVRGLALRSLCSLRLHSILEYVMTPLKVRGTAVPIWRVPFGILLLSFPSYLKLPSFLCGVVMEQASLTDSSPYVRRNGVMGILKVFSLAPDTIRDSDLIDTMYNMIRDRDPQVVANCLVVINEIMRAEGGIAINQAIIHHLMNHIRDFNEWSQCQVLSLVAKYRPATKVRGQERK